MADSVGQFLKEKFSEMQQRNPRFSLRSFAAKVGISAGRMNELIHDKRALSDFYAEKITIALGLNLQEKRRLYSFISTKARKVHSVRKLTREEGLSVRCWENLAILSLLRTDDFEPSFEWIAERLNVSVERVEECFDILQQHQLVKVGNGTIERNSSRVVATATKDTVHHERLKMEKSMEAMAHVAPIYRNHSAVTVATTPEKIKEANEKIKEFRRKLADFLEDGPKTEVYSLTINLFPLTDLRIEGGKVTNE
ncbi:TIGR02147 family protein [Bdellovibrio sp. 22V]|uniref:TIGR02147 family protein n=1 Tax=Bdellovibrio sp. 22V TaxID=3044166 RepID=UPI0025430B7A|nr:TIGR02147 family protein [Bdellovibrio sp. 22V]WII72800.1 TIGR02147 family protein [Bdellovibrio sp. 22V]